jgi:DNA polymerase-3 subunit gamma/tau
VLEELISMLHRIAVAQVVRDVISDPVVLALSQLLSPEDTQLYYQIALMGRKDLPYAPDPKSGLEMALLRMLAFHPTRIEQKKTVKTDHYVAAEVATPQKVASTNITAEIPVKQDYPSSMSMVEWGTLISDLKLKGVLHSLAQNCVLKSFDGSTMELQLSEAHSAFLNDKVKLRLNETLNQHFNKTMRLMVHVGKASEETPAEKEKRRVGERHQQAVKTIENDENIKTILNQFGAAISPNLVQSIDE